MMPNITRGERMAGLLTYLAGPGRHNEHSEPHLVAGDAAIMAWHGEDELSVEAARAIARQVDHPRRAFGVEVSGGSVWHCSLSIAAAEGQLTDQKWAAIATDFVEEMGFTDASGKAPCRWVAVRHGLSEGGNDHIHVAVSLVREDGTKASVHYDRPRSQRVCGKLERSHGMVVLESREHGRGMRGVKPAEQARADRLGQPEAAPQRVARTVRACAAAAVDEAEFVRRVRRAGVLIRPRFATGRDDVVVGYSVALKPSAGERPIWYGGGQLAKDMSLPRLRTGWTSTPDGAAAAAAEWRAAWRGRRVVAPGVELVEPDEQVWGEHTERVRALREQLRAVPAADRSAWAHAARDVSGAFAAWSMRVEPTPGPLAATADALARSAQLPGREVKPRPKVLPSARGAALLLASAASGGRGRMAEAILFRQLANTARAIHDAHRAAGEAQRAAQIAAVVRDQLVAVNEALPPLPAETPEGLAERGQGPGPGRGGSPVPNRIEPRRGVGHRTGGSRDDVER